MDGNERSLIAQLIDVRKREALLREEISFLRDENDKLRAQTNGVLRERLNHALRELDSSMKKNNPRLSNEEWEFIREMRGSCSEFDTL